MPYLMRGALIEYGSDFMGPLPNVVLFQFNPESLSRNIQIPPRPSWSSGRETSQAGEVPVEKITFTAHFSAADQLNKDETLARMFGIGPQLAALEKMVHPTSKISSAIAAAIDAIGDKIMGDGDEGDAVQPIPRENYPKILFIWGPSKVLPVVIESMSITEQHFDNMLNPIQAEVSIGLSVIAVDLCSEDWIAKGAQEYSSLVKEAQAIANLASTVKKAVELIPF